MSSQIDLTTLAAVKAWLTIENTNSDALLSTLVTAWSRTVYGYLSIAIISRQFVERRDGVGNARMMLKQYPVTSVASLTINGQTIPAADPTSTSPVGYLLEPWDGNAPASMQMIDLFGPYCFWRGRQNVAATYNAGYLVIGEAATVPSNPGPYVVEALQESGPFALDQGVSYAGGSALTKVASGPAVGQYAVDAVGNYTFAAADAGRAVLISYSYVPADIAQTVTALVGEDFRYRDRIGQNSKTLGGQETVTYSQAAIPGRYKLMLDQFKKVVPI